MQEIPLELGGIDLGIVGKLRETGLYEPLFIGFECKRCGKTWEGNDAVWHWWNQTTKKLCLFHYENCPKG